MTELSIAAQIIDPGTTTDIELLLGRLVEQTEVFMKLHVIRGVEDGPTVFVTACIHGDELNGMEIVRQLKRLLDPTTLRGTVILVPVVNVFAFIFHSRYLPDRRDLNRSFPGSYNGSQAAHIAHLLLEEVVKNSQYGIDLHTAPVGRYNLPQAWCDLGDPTSRELGLAFGAPVLLHASYREGSLRQAAKNLGVPVVLFEGGEAMRFCQETIRIGTEGCLRVLQHLGMLETAPAPEATVVLENAKWVRARRSGALRPGMTSGQVVEAEGRLGAISDPMARETFKVRASAGGLVLSHATNPLVNKGDAIFRVGF